MKKYFLLSLLLTISINNFAMISQPVWLFWNDPKEMTTEIRHTENQQKIDTLDAKIKKEKPQYIPAKFYKCMQNRRTKKRNKIRKETIKIEIAKIKNSPDIFFDTKWAKPIPYLAGIITHVLHYNILLNSVDDQAPSICKESIKKYALATEVIFISSILATHWIDECIQKRTKSYKINQLKKEQKEINFTNFKIEEI